MCVGAETEKRKNAVVRFSCRYTELSYARAARARGTRATHGAAATARRPAQPAPGRSRRPRRAPRYSLFFSAVRVCGGALAGPPAWASLSRLARTGPPPRSRTLA